MADPIASAFPDENVRLVLIGKTGAGKSSASNTILGQEACEVASGMCSGTEDCDFKEANRDGLNIQITDTPGVCDTHRPFEEVHREIIKSVASVAPGPHAVLMCLRCDQRFTEEEYKAYMELKDLFGHGLVKHMVLVFNGLDSGGNPNFKKLGEKVPNLGKVFEDLGDKVDERIIALNNKAPWENRIEQGNRLLGIVSQVLKDNNGNYFSDDIMEMFEKKLKEKEEKEKKSRAQIIREIVIEKKTEAAAPLKEALPAEKVKSSRCTIL